jgi:hypothetical protein
MRSLIVRILTVVTAVASPIAAAHAQTTGGMDHPSHTMGAAAPPTMPAGQDAYAALASIVALLEADSTTDWSKVNIEALRQHLIVMNDVTLHARSTQSAVTGGARMDVTGDGHVAESIRAMLHAHATMLGREGPYRASVDDIPGGVRFTVTASDPTDQTSIAKIRALGFSGLLTLGAHHAQHHLALARGQAMTHQ